jgi:hypothetical protein
MTKFFTSTKLLPGLWDIQTFKNIFIVKGGQWKRLT